jgi:hypothetical protein
MAKGERHKVSLQMVVAANSTVCSNYDELLIF